MKNKIAIVVICAAALLLIGFSFYQLEEKPDESEAFEVVEDLPVEEATEVAETIEEVATEEVYEEPRSDVYERTYNAPASTTGAEFMFNGVVTTEDIKCTWYSSNDAYHYRTSEWTPDENGIYRDSEGYVVVAAKLKSSPDDTGYTMGEVIEDTPFGAAKVYDTGYMGDKHLDVYVNF